MLLSLCAEKTFFFLFIFCSSCFNSGEKLKILPTATLFVYFRASHYCCCLCLYFFFFFAVATAFIFLLLVLFFYMFQTHTHTVCFTFKKCESKKTRQRRRRSFIFYDNLFTFSSSIILSPYVHDDVNFSFSCYLLLLSSTTSGRKWLIVS